MADTPEQTDSALEAYGRLWDRMLKIDEKLERAMADQQSIISRLGVLEAATGLESKKFLKMDQPKEKL